MVRSNREAIALNDGLYQALLFWGVLVMAILSMGLLLLCTPLGHSLQRRILRLRAGHLKPSQPSLRELEAQTFHPEGRSPYTIGTPAPPYEWVLRITPPPTAHISSASDVNHTRHTLTHRFSNIPRAESGYGLGIHVPEDPTAECSCKAVSETSTGLHTATLINADMDMEEPSRVPGIPASRRASTSEAGHVTPAETEAVVRSESRWDTLLLQLRESARGELVAGMSEEERLHGTSL